MKKLSTTTQLLRSIAVMTVVILLSVAVGGCVDNKYDLDNLNKEITIGGDNIVIPLGKFTDKTLGDLIDDGDLGDLQADPETGIYAYTHPGDSGIFEIETIPSGFDLESQSRQTVIKYPKISTPSFGAIDTGNKEIAPKNMPDGGITDGFKLELSDEGQAECTYTIDEMPSVIKTIDRLYLGDADGSTKGAALKARLLLNGLEEINGGGEITMRIELPDFEISADDPSAINGNIFTQTKQIAEGDAGAEFIIYLNSIDLADLDPSTENRLKSTLDYSFDLTIHTKAGTAGAQMPVFSLTADPVCIDADITTADNATIIDPETDYDNVIDMNYTFGNLDNVKSLSKVQFADGASVTLTIDDNMPEKMSEYLEVKVDLPSYYKFKPGNPKFDYKENVLTAKVEEFKGKGITLDLDYADCSGHAVENGAITLDGETVTTVYFPAGQQLRLSDIKSDNDEVSIITSVNVDNKIHIGAIVGEFNYSKEFDTEVDLSNLIDFGLDLSTISLSPIIEFNVDNTVGSALKAKIDITPIDDNGNEIRNNKITINDITVAANTHDHIIISTRSRKEQFAGKHFVEAELDKLFNGETPSLVKIAATVSTPDEESTIELPENADSVEIEYDYNLTIPLEFEAGANAQFKFSFDDISSELDSVDGVKLKEVVIVAKFDSQIPLDMTLKVTPYDENGRELTDKDVVVGPVSGHDTIKANDKSEVWIGLTLPSGDIADLKKIKKLEGSFQVANNTGSLASLSKDLKLSGVFTLHINGGITIDLDSIGGETEE